MAPPGLRIGGRRCVLDGKRLLFVRMGVRVRKKFLGDVKHKMATHTRIGSQTFSANTAFVLTLAFVFHTFLPSIDLL